MKNFVTLTMRQTGKECLVNLKLVQFIKPIINNNEVIASRVFFAGSAEAGDYAEVQETVKEIEALILKAE